MGNKQTVLTISIVLNTVLTMLLLFLVLLNQGIIKINNEDIVLDNNDSQDNQDNEDISPDQEVEITIFYFDRDKLDIPDNFDYLTGVTRTTTRKDVATYSIEQIIQGPTETEKEQYNLEETFGEGHLVWFVSESTCSGKDFTVEISEGRATVQFCRDTMLAGDMSGVIIEDQIERTLKQFVTVDEVQILNSQGNCFNDMAGFEPDECIF